MTNAAIPTPEQYARLYWHARQLAASRVRNRIRDLLARDAYTEALELAATLPAEPAHVLAARRRVLANDYQPKGAA